MAWSRFAAVVLAWTMFSPAFAGTPGIFQGEVYRDDHGTPGWIYVRGHQGTLRKVEVSKARVVYADSVPAGERSQDAAVDLVQGAEVQVTAEQDGAGEWRASRVEILKVSRPGGSKPVRRTGAKLCLGSRV